MIRAVLLLILFALISPNLCGAEETPLSSANAQPPVYILSLDEVTALALENNFDIQMAEFDVQIKRTDKDSAESIFDTVIEAEVKYRDDQRKRSSTILGAKELNNDYNLGISKKTPSGTTLGLDFDNNRNWTDSTFATINPAHDSSVKLSIEQDLGKNFFGLKDRSNIKITRLDIENSEYTFLDTIEQNIAEVQKAYWKLVSNRHLVRIYKEMLKYADELYSLHQRKIKDGLIEEPELFASQANVEQRRTDLLVAENNLEASIEELKLLLNIDKSVVKILPKDEFTVGSVQESLVNSLRAAFERRRDYSRAKNEIKSKNIQLSVKKNNLWPEINLEASFTRNGIDDHFSQAMNQITDEDNPEYYLGLKVKLFLENRQAKSEYDRAKLEKARALIAIKKIERVVLKEIVDGTRSCQVLRNRFENQRLIAQLQENKLSAEERRFKYGRSNTDTIIRYQDDLLAAQLLAVQSAYEYQAAVVDLALKENTLLDKYWKDKI